MPAPNVVDLGLERRVVGLVTGQQLGLTLRLDPPVTGGVTNFLGDAAPSNA
jgi:hypothetical protein